MALDENLIAFVRDCERDRLKRDLASTLRWMRESLNDVERSIKEGDACGGSFGTMTEQLHQLIGQWDMLVKFSKNVKIDQLPAAFDDDEDDES